MSDHCERPKAGPKGTANGSPSGPSGSNGETPLVSLRGRRGAAPASDGAGYWKSPETRTAPPTSRGEFPGGLPAPGTAASSDETSRRDFLTMMGFGLAAAGAAACRAPEHKAIPLPIASEDLVPGVANHYATTCGGCASACSLVVKQRDGRPIKIEGNDESTLFGGATCATGQATVLSLYDHERLRGPLWQDKPTSWRFVDEQIAHALSEAVNEAANEASDVATSTAPGDGKTRPGNIALVTSTLHGPSTIALLERWRAAFPGLRHVVYDPISSSGLRQASLAALGKAIVPHYSFDRAKMIVGLDADFLGTWLSPVEFARQYGRGRAPERGAHLHVQFETGMSVTGSNADRRIPVRPSELAPIAAALLRRVAHLAHPTQQGAELPEVADPIEAEILDEVAVAMWEHRGLSLVVSGGNDPATDRAVLAINALLGNFGCTLDVERPSQQRQGDDAAMAALVAAMERGEIHTVILHGVNPGYDYADPDRFLAALAKVRCAISTADRRDETSARCHAVCPDHHFLESWGDAEPVVGHLSLTQPLLAPLYDTRSFVESLLTWMGEPASHYRYLRDYWISHLAPRQREHADAERFWERTLERGVLELPPAAADASAAAPPREDWPEALRLLAEQCRSAPPAITAEATRVELSLFESVPLRDGRHANNPWLLELPDPITKVTWGNVATIAPSLARQLGLATGDVVRLERPGASPANAAGAGALELPVFLQPGQHPATLSVALGYGRQLVGKAGAGVGVNAFPLAQLREGQRQRWLGDVRLTATGGKHALASTQEHFSMEGRPIVLEVPHDQLQGKAAPPTSHPSLWPERPHGERNWGMTIDLDSCTGCSACVIACQAENNVPVIGKDQVQRQRIMHWIRIDRYYRGSEEAPHSVHQPMMCQHCGHAPCETVCPVLATTTSSEGLNQQVYNRCIGTRYCANNCPYKVRRFNWFNYTENPRFDFNMANPVGRLVLNPDVTVRTRGVMEKCSLCVQRIHAAKNAAVKSERALADGDIETACQQVCPTDAIVFGDLADPRSQVAKRMGDERTYRVLDELGTRPNVAYLKKVRHGHTT